MLINFWKLLWEDECNNFTSEGLSFLLVVGHICLLLSSLWSILRLIGYKKETLLADVQSLSFVSKWLHYLVGFIYFVLISFYTAILIMYVINEDEISRVLIVFDSLLLYACIQEYVFWIYEFYISFEYKYVSNSCTWSIRFSWYLIGGAVTFQLVSLFQDCDYYGNKQWTTMTFLVFARACVQYFLCLIGLSWSCLNGRFKLDERRISSSPEEQDLVKLLDTNCVSQRDSCPSTLSRLSFAWIFPLIWIKRNKSQLELEDFFPLPLHISPSMIYFRYKEGREKTRIRSSNTAQTGEDETTYLLEGQQQQLQSVVYDGDERIHKKNEKENLMQVFNTMFGWSYYPLAIPKLLADILDFTAPLWLNALVTFIEDPNEPMWHGYFYVGGMITCSLVKSFIALHFDYNLNKVCLQIRGLVLSTVYLKTLKLKSSGFQHFKTGSIIDFMSTDTDRIVNFCPSFHQMWSLPFQIVVSMYLLYLQIGYSFLIGLSIALILIPINKVIASQIGKYSKILMENKDKRVELMQEIIGHIREIKLKNLIDSMRHSVTEIREKEVHALKVRKYLDALCVYFWASTPILISVTSFTVYSLLGNELTAVKVFTSLALFNILVGPLNAFPWVINGFMEARVSARRVNEFLEYPEQKLYPDDGMLPRFQNASFLSLPSSSSIDSVDSVPDDKKRENELLLKEIDCTLGEYQHLYLVGKIGSGKSCFLKAILGELELLDSETKFFCAKSLTQVIGYSSQETWLQHGSIKDNILFGRKFDSDRYAKVLYACALMEDIKFLSKNKNILDGSNIEVGEQGNALSGGQRARVSLARSVYGKCNLYLIDEPFSSIDANQAEFIMKECILGLLKNECVVLSTHNIHCLSQVVPSKRYSKFAYIESGSLQKFESLSHLIDMCGGDALRQELHKSVDHYKATNEGTNLDIDDLNQTNTDVNVTDEDEHQEISNNNNESKNDSVDVPTALEEPEALVEKEHREYGTLKAKVYISYFKNCGLFLCLIVVLTMIGMQSSKIFTDAWISTWTSQQKLNSTKINQSVNPNDSVKEAIDVTYMLIIYAILCAVNSIWTISRAFSFAYAGLCAAIKTHDEVLVTVLNARSTFFNKNPIGRIINRFSTDVYDVDDALPFILNIFISQVAGLMGAFVVMSYGVPMFLLAVPVIAIFYYFLQLYYRDCSREIKRFESTSRSPVYSYFHEVITGCFIIRSFNQQHYFFQNHLKAVHTFITAQYNSMLLSQWLNFSLQILGVLSLFFVCVFALLQHHYHFADSGLIGLSITYALGITNLLSGMISSFTETEKQLVSMERLSEYTDKIDREDIKDLDRLHVDEKIVTDGQIDFKDVFVRYREGLKPALNNISFTIKAGEKIGIRGHSGAGKSTLLSAMFRLIELNGGHIEIDGKDISGVNLSLLRSSMSVITQTPLLLTGSLRFNLDPHNKATDNRIWSVLNECQIGDKIKTLEGGLDYAVSQKGNIFSSGEKQLLCISNIILNHSKIIIIDEATSQVDLEMDLLIQEIIERYFKSSTVITIAHRLNTLRNCDRIIMLKEGKIFSIEDNLKGSEKND